LDEYEPYPGYQKDFSFYITIGIDTSGSVGDDEFKDFMSEIFGIMKIKEGVTVRLVMFDAALQFEKVLEHEDQDNFQSRDAYYRYGYGGTDFTPFLRYVSGDLDKNLWVENATQDLEHPPRIPDLVVLLTDGYAPVGPSEGGPIPMYLPNCPLIWCLTANGKEDPYMQPRVVRINR
jgi:predicted metal-dependent peptidase